MPTRPFAQQDSIKAVIEELVRTDEALQKRVRRLITNAMNHAEWTMQHGTDAQKDSIMRTIVLPMMKALGDVDDDAHLSEQREAHNRMIEAMKEANTRA